MKSIELTKKLLGLQENMYYFGFTLTSNREDANDLMQETNFKVLKNLEKYRNSINFKGWVLTIMRNIFINNYHRAKYEVKQTDTSDNFHLLNLPQKTDLTTPEGWMAFQEIIGIINSFPDNYKTPFLMYIEGYKYYEIAETLCLPLGTVKSRIYFMRKQLQILLHDYF